MFNKDTYNAAQGVINDAKDTEAKLFGLVGLLSDLDFYMDEMEEDRTSAFNHLETLRSKIEPIAFNLGNQVFTFKGTTWHDPKEQLPDMPGFEFTSGPGFTTSISYMNTGEDVKLFINGEPYAPTEWKLPNILLTGVGGHWTLSSLIAQLKGSIQVQQLLQDIASVVQGRLNLAAIISKWSNFTDWAANAKAVFMEFLSSGAHSPAEIVQWLACLLTREQDIEANAQGQLNFSSTDYKVLFSWSTVWSAVGQTLSAALTAISIMIKGVLGPILLLVGAVTSLLTNLFGNISNPLADIDDTKRLFIPIPIMQIDIPDDSEWMKLAPLEQCTIDCTNYTARFWVDDHQHGHLELFLRPSLGPGQFNESVNFQYGFASLYEQTYNVDDLYRTGLDGGATEEAQAMIVMANMSLLAEALLGRVTTQLDTNTIIANGEAHYWNIVKDDKQTVEYRTYAARAVCYLARRHIVLQPEDMASTDAARRTVLAGIGNWFDVINILYPVMRTAMNTYVNASVLTTINLVVDLKEYGTYQNFNKFLMAADPDDAPLGYICDPVACAPQAAGIILPRYSSKGLLAITVGTLVVAALVTTAVVATTVSVKRSISRHRLNLMNKATDQREQYQKMMSGIDPDDPSGTTRKEFTKAEKTTAFNKYYKAVKRYNRQSWLWGGSTFSLINGWDDGSNSDQPSALEQGSALYDTLVGSSTDSNVSMSDIKDILIPSDLR